jgi:hypothetical protein
VSGGPKSIDLRRFSCSRPIDVKKHPDNVVRQNAANAMIPALTGRDHRPVPKPLQFSPHLAPSFRRRKVAMVGGARKTTLLACLPKAAAAIQLSPIQNGADGLSVVPMLMGLVLMLVTFGGDPSPFVIALQVPMSLHSLIPLIAFDRSPLPLMVMAAVPFSSLTLIPFVLGHLIARIRGGGLEHAGGCQSKPAPIIRVLAFIRVSLRFSAGAGAAGMVV